MAVANYHDANGHYPPAVTRGPDGKPWHSWRVLVLPYIEESALFKEYRFDEPWDGPNNRKLAGRMPKMFTFHGTEGQGRTVTSYLAVTGDGTVWPTTGTVTSADVTDGTGRTILLVENHGANVHWMEPRDLALDTVDLTIDAPGGVSSRYTRPAVLTADGAVFRLNPGLAPDVLRAFFTIRGGEPIRESEAGWTLLPDGRQREVRE